jgi:hypothetical protein
MDRNVNDPTVVLEWIGGRKENTAKCAALRGITFFSLPTAHVVGPMNSVIPPPP